MPKNTATILRDVHVKVTGGVRFAAVDVEAQSVPLKKGKAFAGERRIRLTPSTIDLFLWVKGGTGANYEAEVSINKVTAKFSGTLTSAGQAKEMHQVPFTTFKL